MNKEDILLKSRQENANGDERQKRMALESMIDSYIVILTIFVIFTILNLILTLIFKKEFFDTKTFMMVFILTITTMAYRKYKMTHDKTSLWAFILSLTAIAALLIAFILTGISKL